MKPNIHLHVHPGVTVEWEEFRNNYPTHSIALDGFVAGAPAYDTVGPYANFDHHHGVSRLATRSTSMQVVVAIGLGLFDVFKKDDMPFANVFVNDCDQDVCLSYYLLIHADLIHQIRIENEIAKLIIFEDFLDTTAGAYPININRPIVRKQAWVFELYDRARAAGQLSSMSADQMRELIFQTSERISQLAKGEAHECELDTSYREIGGGKGWKMIQERGVYARTKLYSDGIRAFVSVRECEPGRYSYVIGRMSPFINFPLDKIFLSLNEIESRVGSSDCWGGSDTIGGSPRKTGSSIPPEQIEEVINKLI